ncbi:hypothetical protein MANES_18G120350v8 [Manihot esculenta]|uniref:Uncharacterized protein n=1 Tax=Manihot esculenta TaxID=3983 RepID=A0ACC8C6M9_MANES|nr:hypothetical protein MANES_18G120350v8 [Manihot esculenta]
MATLNSQEGQSVVRPPFFDGNDFLYWKNRMYYFLKSEGVDLWDIVENGPFFLTRVIDGNQEQKPKSEWSELEKRRVALNDKAIHILFCALSRSEYNKVCMKSTAKEIWDALVVTHEGTNQVKENKMESLIYQYELFKMKSDEIISQMYDRFIEIIGGMKSLGKTFTNEELVKKILRCLPKEWLPKVTSLKDAKDLSKVQLDELLGNLIDYEMTLKREQVEEPSKMKKNIALRIASEDTSEEEEEISEEELALFIPRKNFRKEKGESSKKEVVICYECNKPGHYKVDCPKLKKPIKKFKKKAFKATWDESSDTEEEDVGDEIANMCFMALEESSNEFSYDELVDALKLMNDELEKSHKKNKILKCELASFKRENNGCSRHMTGNSSHFISIEKKDGSGQVTFGDNGKGKIVGIGKVGKENSHTLDKVLLVDGLKHNLLSVSQLCDKGCRVIFEPKSCFVSRMSDNKILVASLGGMHYSFVIVDDYSRYTWVVFLAHKDDCFDAFKSFTKKVQNEKGFQISSIRSDHGKFDSKTDEGIFLGYSISSKSYRVFNKRTLIVEESMHVIFYESNPFAPRKEILNLMEIKVNPRRIQ